MSASSDLLRWAPARKPHRDFGGSRPALSESVACVWSGLRLEGRVDDAPVAGQAGRLDEFVVPLHGELLRGLVDERLHEGVEVARIEAGGAGRQTARHVE